MSALFLTSSHKAVADRHKEGWNGFEGDSFVCKKETSASKTRSKDSTTYTSGATTRSHSKKCTTIHDGQQQWAPEFENKLPVNSNNSTMNMYEDISFANGEGQLNFGASKSHNYYQETGEFTARDFTDEHNNTTSSDKNKLKGTVLVEISLGPNHTETLVYKEGDSITQKAKDFCTENGLDEDTVVIIEQVIQSNLTKTQKSKRRQWNNDTSQLNNSKNDLKKSDTQSVSSKSSKESKDKPAIVIELDLGDCTDKIYAFENDDPNVLALEFCKKHGLDQQAQPFLAKSIGKEIKKLPKSSYDGDKFFAGPNDKLLAPPVKPVSQPEADPYQLRSIQEDSSDAVVLTEPKESLYSDVYERWHRLISEKSTVNQKSDKLQKKSDNSREIEANQAPGSARKNRQNSPSNDAIFNKLYYQGMRQKREKDLKKAQYEKECAERDKKDLTFHPNISPLGSSGTRPRSQSPLYEPTRYYKEIEKRANRDKALITERTKVIAEVCPFKPTISEASQKLTTQANRSVSPNIHARLHQEAGLRIQKREEFVKEKTRAICTFKPELNENTRQLTPTLKETQKELTDRLVREAKELQNKKFQKKNAEASLVDPVTGQKMFHPIIPHTKYYQKVKQRDDEHYQISLDTTTLKVRRLESSQSPSNVTHENQNDATSGHSNELSLNDAVSMKTSPVVQINSLQSIVQKIQTDTSFKRSVSPNQRSFTRTNIEGLSSNSPCNLTKNYQRILAKKSNP